MSDENSSPLPGIGAALARVEVFANGIGRRTRFWGWLALAAAPAVWAIGLYTWVFESWGVALAWLPVLLVLAIPGLVLLGFGKRVRRMADLPDKVSGEIGALVAEARGGITSELEGVKTSGIAGLRSLVGSLKDLRSFGGDIRGILAGGDGTLRLINPIYLLIVVGAALAAGLLAILLAGALVLLFVI
ncbi:MAG: hypothetical protein MUP76_10865 [Acidimicrobiia bacterium]|nr:hypothetical protein [Acidimicrobiia bacterium]